MMLKIILAVAVLVVLFLIIVALRPNEFRVTRKAIISASPTVLFAQVNDLHKFQAWSPFAKMDPAAKNTFEGPATGTGASMSWIGNKKLGEGRNTIIESRPDEMVKFRLDFKKPFAATHLAELTFKPEGNQTSVSWTITGRFSFCMKAFELFMNFDQMVGNQFEKGLADLRAIVEAPGKKPQ